MVFGKIEPQKLTLNSENAQFLMTLPQTVLQDIKKSFEYVHCDVKIYWISPENTMKFHNCLHATIGVAKRTKELFQLNAWEKYPDLQKHCQRLAYFLKKEDCLQNFFFQLLGIPLVSLMLKWYIPYKIRIDDERKKFHFKTISN